MLLAIVVKMYTRTCYERVRTKGKMLKFKLTDRSSLKSMKMKMAAYIMDRQQREEKDFKEQSNIVT